MRRLVHYTRVRKLVTAGGFMILALAMSSGVLTGSTSWASGVSVSSSAQAMADQAYSYPLQFDASVQNSLVTLQGSDPSMAPVASSFYTSYVTATKEYGVSLLSAAQVYSMAATKDPAAAKNAYIDGFNTARAHYFDSLESARNSLVNQLSGKNDVAKDMFVNEFNSARDAYNGQLESVKNEITSL